jgi:60 kDa SS-A/Ro ribonucleoprotein
MALSNITLSVEQWKDIGRNMPWNTLRMNLNTLNRHGVFADAAYVEEIAQKLRDESLIKKVKVFPYQLLTAYQNTQDIPVELSLALQDAMEVATQNVPVFGKNVAVCIDLSQSMHSPITGNRAVATKTSCVDVAALFASCIVRQNPSARLVAWASTSQKVQLNPRDSVMTNSQKMAGINVGGGTNAVLGLQSLNQNNWKGDVVIYVSDNQSWMHGLWGSQSMAAEWNLFKKNNPKAKLVCIDITSYGTTQVPDNKDVLNIGGFSDNVWPVIENFVNHSGSNFVSTVEQVKL